MCNNAAKLEFPAMGIYTTTAILRRPNVKQHKSGEHNVDNAFLSPRAT